VVRSHNFEDAGAAETFEGLAAGSIFPSWAVKSACPMSIRTERGKDLKSLRDAPIHLTGFSSPSTCIPVYVYHYIGVKA